MRVVATIEVVYELNEGWYESNAGLEHVLELDAAALTRNYHIISYLLSTNPYSVVVRKEKNAK